MISTGRFLDEKLTVQYPRLGLDLERNRVRTIRRKTLKRLTQPPGVWADLYLTAVAVSAELMLEQYGSGAAIQHLTRSSALNGRAGRPW